MKTVSNAGRTLVQGLFLVALCVGLCPLGHAASVLFTLDGNFAPPDYEFYSFTDTSNQVHNSIPVGPYITRLNGGPFNDMLAYTICYDFNSPTNVGTAYSGTFVSVPDPSAPTYTADLEATYLVNKLNADGLLTAPLAVRGAISMAIWQIMNTSSNTGLANFPTDPTALPYEVEAATAVTNGAWTAWDASVYPMWVPDNPAVQRFGTVLAGESPVPEPPTSGLIGLAIIGVAIAGRKLRAAK